MPFQVSPGVLVKEVDLTNVVPAVSTSIGAIAGAFENFSQLVRLQRFLQKKNWSDFLVNPMEITLRHSLLHLTSFSTETH